LLAFFLDFLFKKFIEFLNIYSITPNFLFISFLAVFSGFLIRKTLVLSGQHWARTYSNSLTYLLLPVIGLTITQIISGNIALSLGMVGALSIIRFRHPVKSPLELTIYFLLLTIGITLTSSPIKALFLCFLSCLIIYLYSLYLGFKNIGKLNLNTTLNLPFEGNSYLIEIESKEEISFNEFEENLLFSFEKIESKEFIYKLKFNTLNEVNNFKSYLLRFNKIISIKKNIL